LPLKRKMREERRLTRAEVAFHSGSLAVLCSNHLDRVAAVVLEVDIRRLGEGGEGEEAGKEVERRHCSLR